MNLKLGNIKTINEMKTLSYLFFITLFIFSSCSKVDTGKIIIAGTYDSDLLYYEFSPPLKVELSLDTLTDNYIGEDSIDINQDGVYDIIISHRIHLPPKSGTPSYDHFPFYRLTLKNGLQVATKLQSYPVGHGQLNDVNWVDALSYKTRIDTWSDWSENNETRTMWAIPPVSTAPYGPWYNLTNEEKYIGIRMKIDSRFKYGWIKVNVISREDMQFLSYALEK
ncbi:hypothetical protein [Maribellus maritimus]|uniref:hypothetical protein n=1 Tax=Maribellus maritimus TaxID=2870838 RepID=UPI001EECCE3A|nr:hypothetical protein [Maribellus maritimus]MCG6191510.1 hypothetical protein [Maribellus maritimus]